jgi:hypothetical protein
LYGKDADSGVLPAGSVGSSEITFEFSIELSNKLLGSGLKRGLEEGAMMLGE